VGESLQVGLVCPMAFGTFTARVCMWTRKEEKQKETSHEMAI
jgi:hypothetical protein